MEVSSVIAAEFAGPDLPVLYLAGDGCSQMARAEASGPTVIEAVVDPARSRESVSD
jgi:hypothetical protein